jgi:hypothetical protein
MLLVIFGFLLAHFLLLLSGTFFKYPIHPLIMQYQLCAFLLQSRHMWPLVLHGLHVYLTPMLVLICCDKQLFIHLCSFMCQNTTCKIDIKTTIVKNDTYV